MKVKCKGPIIVTLEYNFVKKNYTQEFFMGLKNYSYYVMNSILKK